MMMMILNQSEEGKKSHFVAITQFSTDYTTIIRIQKCSFADRRLLLKSVCL
jgi:hypothetical protein